MKIIDYIVSREGKQTPRIITSLSGAYSVYWANNSLISSGSSACTDFTNTDKYNHMKKIAENQGCNNFSYLEIAKKSIS